MKALTGTIVVVALLAVMTACTSKPSAPVDNTAEICAKVSELTQPDPALVRKITEAYQSSDPASKQAADEARSKMYRGWAKSLEPLIGQAAKPELKNVLRQFVDSLRNGVPAQDDAVKLMNVCGRSSIAPSP